MATDKSPVTKPDVEKILGLPQPIKIGGVEFELHPIRVAQFKAFVDCSPILLMERLYDVFVLREEEFNGERMFRDLLALVLQDDPEPLITIMIAKEWKKLRSAIIEQNDLDFEKKLDKKGGRGNEMAE